MLTEIRDIITTAVTPIIVNGPGWSKLVGIDISEFRDPQKVAAAKWN